MCLLQGLDRGLVARGHRATPRKQNQRYMNHCDRRPHATRRPADVRPRTDSTRRGTPEALQTKSVAKTGSLWNLWVGTALGLRSVQGREKKRISRCLASWRTARAAQVRIDRHPSHKQLWGAGAATGDCAPSLRCPVSGFAPLSLGFHPRPRRWAVLHAPREYLLGTRRFTSPHPLPTTIPRFFFSY